MVPPLLRHSDHIALLPSRCLPDEAVEAFVALPPPIAVEGFPLHLAWHSRLDRDPVVRHVATIIVDLLAS